MKIAFYTELPFNSKVSYDYPNMRTEFAWMYALDADHFNINRLNEIQDYDHVFVIFPKGEVYLNAVGSKLIDKENPISNLLNIDFINVLKRKNKKVHFIQEGPHWLWNDYEIVDQIHYYNMIASCDSIFCHNEIDRTYYKGLFPGKEINIIQTLMIDDLVKDIPVSKENKTIIGGNFARWYGGFESYIVANNFHTEIWVQESHAKRHGEEMVEGIKHLPRLSWIDWMKTLSTFKYAVHLMPTVAAGTFSLNCAYFGIPCIGNADVDTQRLCHPNLSVDINNLEKVRDLVNKLKTDKDFYYFCSDSSKKFYHNIYDIKEWKNKMFKILNKI